jgi:hypothetical protein
VGPVQVTFVKGQDGRFCRWTARRSKRRTTTGGMGVGHRQLPHDLIQFAIESELGIGDGFWGSIEQGATFKSLDRKRTEAGKAVVRRNRDGLDRAEAVANDHARRWAEGEPTPLAPTLDDLHRRWLALPDGASLDLDWPGARVRPARRSGDPSIP